MRPGSRVEAQRVESEFQVQTRDLLALLQGHRNLLKEQERRKAGRHANHPAERFLKLVQEHRVHLQSLTGQEGERDAAKEALRTASDRQQNQRPARAAQDTTHIKGAHGFAKEELGQQEEQLQQCLQKSQ